MNTNPEPQQESYTLYKNNEYFNDSKQWYFDKYLSQYKARSVFIVISIFCALVFLVCFNVFIHGFKPTKYYSGVLYVDTPTAEKGNLKLHKLPVDFKNTNEIIAKFYITQFIEAFESYTNETKSLGEINQKVSILQPFVAPNVMNEYRQTLSETLIPEFLRGYRRVVNIKYCEFLHKNLGFFTTFKAYFKSIKISNQALCEFDINFYNQDQLIQTHSYQSLVSFTFRPVQTSQNNKKNDINFMVTDYKSLQLK